jgi:hypothetical protein
MHVDCGIYRIQITSVGEPLDDLMMASGYDHLDGNWGSENNYVRTEFVRVRCLKNRSSNQGINF